MTSRCHQRLKSCSLACFGSAFPKTSTRCPPQIKIETPNSGGYVDVTASHFDNRSDRHFGGYVDVTALVRAGGNGTYTVGGAAIGEGANHYYGGWTLAVAYEQSSEPWRNLTVFNGFEFASRTNSYEVPLTVSGFTAPPTGPVGAQIGVQTGEGDAGYDGTSIEVNGTKLSDSLNPIDNTQNSTISILGNAGNTSANPSYSNQLGFDADILAADGLIPPNATSAQISLRSSGDLFGVNLITTAIDVYVPDLSKSLSKSATDLNGGLLHPGDEIEYRIRFDNTGQDPAENAAIRDEIPVGTTYVPGSLRVLADTGTLGAMTDAAGDDNARYDAADNQVVFNVGTGATAGVGGQVDPLTAGGQAHEVAFRVKVNGGTEGTTISNQAVVGYIAQFTGRPYSASSEAAELDVHALVDLSITKSDDVDPAIAGNNVEYTLSVANAGPSPAENVVAVDELPAGASFVSGQNCENAGATVTCQVGDLAVGASTDVVITVAVDGAFTGTTLSNIASVSSDTFETNMVNSSTSESTQVERKVDLAVTKSAPAAIDAGEEVTYTIKVDNNGTSDALGVELSDPVPLDVSQVSATNGGSCDTTVVCTWPVLTAGDSTTVTVVANVPPQTPAGTVITNTATATSTDPDQNAADNTDSAVTTIDATADLSISKIGPATVMAGDQASYVIEVGNAGPSSATNVVVTDPVPSAEYRFNSAASSSGCAVANDTVTCDTSELAPTETASFTVVFDVDADAVAGTTVTNTATVSSDADDPSGTNNASSAETVIGRSADLSVIKDDNTALVAAGSQIRYTLSYANAGPSDASDVTVTDTLPAGVSFDSESSSDACSASGSSVTCTLGVLPVGASDTFDVVVDLNASIAHASALENHASISGAEDDPTRTNNSSTVTTSVERRSALELTVSDSVDPVLAGNEVSYTLEVTNLGPSADDNVSVIDTLAQGTTFVSASSGCAHDAATVTCDAGTMLPGSSAVFSIVVATDSSLANGSVLTNRATASGDRSPTVGVAEETTVATAADLALSKTGPATATAGTSMTYALEVSNAGPSIATDAVLTDAFPSGTSYLSHTVTAGSGSCEHTQTSITCTQSSLRPDSKFAVEVVVAVDQRVAHGTTVTNQAFITSNTADPNPANDSAKVTTRIDRSADLSITKLTMDDSVEAGESATFSIKVTNNGPSAASQVVVTDQLPDGFSLDADASANCSADVTCSVPTELGVGESYTFTVVANVDSVLAAGTYANAASAAGAEADPNATNNSASAEIEVTHSADLKVVKTASDAALIPGTTTEYTVIVTNQGPSTANGVTVTDALPAGLTFDAANSSSQCSSGVTCTKSSLAPGAIATFTISVRVDPALTDSVTNTATVASDTHDPDSTNDSSVANSPVVPTADLSVTKSANDIVTAGQTLHYTIEVANAGPSTATNTQAVDALSDDVEFVSASPGCVHDDGVVTCSQASVAPGASTSFEITVLVPAATSDDDPLVNDVDVSSDAADPDLSDNSASAQTTVSRLANVHLTTSPSVGAVTAGGSVRHTILVRNDGPSSAHNVTVANTVASGMRIAVVATALGDCFPSGTTVTCSIADLAPGDTMTITVVSTIDASVTNGSALDTHASVATTTEESDATDNTATAAVTVSASADLAVTKTADTNGVAAGESVSYEINTMNNGPADARNVVLTDVVPAHLTIDEISPSTCSTSGNVVTCERATVAVGHSFALTIDATVNEDAPDDSIVTNTASVTASTADPNDSNNTSSHDLGVSRSADVSVTKEATRPTVSAGETVYYNVVAANDGPSSATNVAVVDTIPAGLVYNPTLSASICEGSATAVTCSVGTVRSGASVPFAIAFDVPGSFEDENTIGSEATITATEDDPVSENNSDRAEVTVANQAEISIVKDATGFAVAGESMNWELTVANAGPADAHDVAIIDALPDGTTFNASGSDSRCSLNDDAVLCDVGTLVAGDSDVITLKVGVAPSAADQATITNTATISSSTDDPLTANNESSDEVPVVRDNNLRIVKNDLADPAVAGENVEWSITVANDGPSDASGTTLVDKMPPGFTAVAVDDTDRCAIEDNTVNCDFGTLEAADSATVVITAATDPSLADGSVHHNTGTAEGRDVAEAVADTEATTIVRRSDLSVTKSSDEAVVAGTNQAYTIAVNNAGPADADNVVVTDSLPAGTSFVSDSNGVCEAAGPLVTCELGALEAASSTDFELVVAVTDAAPNPLANVVLVESDSIDPDSTNNTSTDTTEITYSADVTVTKTTAADIGVAGEALSWDVVVTNHGPSIANDVTIEDVLPDGVTFETASPTCANGEGTVNCSHGSLLSGESATFRIVGILDDDFDGPVTNTVSAASTTADPDPFNGTASVTTDTERRADLVLANRLLTAPVVSGSGATYELTVNNSGPSVATDMTITNEFPLGVVPVAVADGCSIDGQTITCIAPALDNGAELTFMVDVVVAANMAGDQAVVNTASVAAVTVDPDLTSNTASATAMMARDANLTVEKSILTADATAGTDVTFEIVVTNDGPSDAADVVITDVVDPTFAVISVADECTASGNTVECERAELANGESWTVQLVARPSVGSIGEATNSASVTSPDGTTATANVAFDVRAPRSRLAISKSTADVVTKEGQHVTWAIALSNDDEATAAPVVVTDTVPAGQRAVSGTSDDATCVVGTQTVTCEVAAGFSGTAEITIVTEVTDLDTPVTNQVVASLDHDAASLLANTVAEATVLKPKQAGGSLAITGRSMFGLLVAACGAIAFGTVLVGSGRLAGRGKADD